MTRPDLENVPSFYLRYVDHVRDMDLPDALASADKQVQDVLKTISKEKADYRYEEGKWTIREVINHMMDAERVFAYRALRFSRNDHTPLPSFEEKNYAHQANAGGRTIEQLAAEKCRLRETTMDLFASFTPEMLKREGVASNSRVSVLNLGYLIAGHDVHHCRVLLERYLNR